MNVNMYKDEKKGVKESYQRLKMETSEYFFTTRWQNRIYGGWGIEEGSGEREREREREKEKELIQNEHMVFI